MKPEEARAAPTVSQTKQGAEARAYGWVEGTIWTDRMISALVNGVKGGGWFSLIDDDHKRWPNAFFAREGLFALHTAYLMARDPR